jgi:hypothetical protein
VAGCVGACDAHAGCAVNRAEPPEPTTPSAGRGPGSCLALCRRLRGTTTEMPCDFAPDSGLVWTCRGHRVLSADRQRWHRDVLHRPSQTDKIGCGWAASFVVSTVPFPADDSRSNDEEGYLVCRAHAAWLYEHELIDGMSSGTAADRDAQGAWRVLWWAAREPEPPDPTSR